MSLSLSVSMGPDVNPGWWHKGSGRGEGRMPVDWSHSADQGGCTELPEAPQPVPDVPIFLHPGWQNGGGEPGDFVGSEKIGSIGFTKSSDEYATFKNKRSSASWIRSLTHSSPAFGSHGGKPDASGEPGNRIRAQELSPHLQLLATDIVGRTQPSWNAALVPKGQLTSY